ncbi:hypothetical protein [Alishewanella jeotgali]|uniref:Thiamin/hydroxymethyl pyrimidine-binding YkoF putative domain-containing protein n=1 Tax=Alishewanella jeotgali KCTC 22429 TaxID=1129374 RepID=H3ZD66_9ALTE|nr:hypothetical protein [Alishewanella jeotgali]EHR41499.1 hypothetical protein AJE_06421 [Alishewanella jeotgali KCTC 22429]
MQLSVEISKYPLAEDYKGPILAFLGQLAQEAEIEVLTNTMSTQIFGEYDAVMQALQRCMRWSMEHYGKLVFVCKFIPGDLRP